MGTVGLHVTAMCRQYGLRRHLVNNNRRKDAKRRHFGTAAPHFDRNSITITASADPMPPTAYVFGFRSSPPLLPVNSHRVSTADSRLSWSREYSSSASSRL